MTVSRSLVKWVQPKWRRADPAHGSLLSDGSFTLFNPVGITITRKDFKVTDQIQAVRFGGSSSSSSSSSSSGGAGAQAPLTTPGALSASDSFPQSSYVRWTTIQYSACCFVASRRVYKLIPGSGTGVSGTNYDETDYGYDVMKRQNRVVTPGGTITRTTFEARGLPTGTWTGTNDTGATSTNPAGSGPPNNMVQITGLVYDGNSAGGDGSVTQRTDYVDSTGTNKCFKEVDIQTWTIPGGRYWGATTNHAAVHIQFCDDTDVYFDNDALGGDDHIFFPGSVPKGWY